MTVGCSGVQMCSEATGQSNGGFKKLDHGLTFAMLFFCGFNSKVSELLVELLHCPAATTSVNRLNSLWRISNIKKHEA